jgi:hypothetical protein
METISINCHDVVLALLYQEEKHKNSSLKERKGTHF